MQSDQEGKELIEFWQQNCPCMPGLGIGASRSAHSLLFGANPAGKVRQREAENRPGSWPNGAGSRGAGGSEAQDLPWSCVRRFWLPGRTHPPKYYPNAIDLHPDWCWSRPVFAAARPRRQRACPLLNLLYQQVP